MFGLIIRYSRTFRVGDQRDRPVNVFEKSVLRELRRTYKVGRVQLVLVQGVVPERLEHVGQQANVAQQIESHVLLKILTVENLPHVLGLRVVRLQALHASELVEKSLS